jgi:hypothetical protein
MPPVLDKIVFVARLAKTADVDKEIYTAHSGYLGPGQIATSAVRMNIQPASAETTVLVDGIFGKTYRAFTSASGVVEGMQVTVSGTGAQYFVRGREVHDNGILPRHYELILTKDKR